MQEKHGKGGGGSEFWHFKGFVRLDGWRLEISETYNGNIYLWSHDSIEHFSTTHTNQLVNCDQTRVPQLFSTKKGSQGFYPENWRFYKISGKCLNFSALVLFFLSVFLTFWWNAFFIGNKVLNGIARLKIGLSYIFMRNVSPSSF